MFTIKALKPQPHMHKSKHPAKDLTELGRGIKRGNPKYCLRCGQPIRRGEAWVKRTSPDRAYSVIAHARCSNGH